MKISVQTQAEKRLRAILWTLAVGALAGSFWLNSAHRSGPACLFRAALHLPCPGCGLTRSWSAIWRGEIGESLWQHPLGLPLFVALTGYVVLVLVGKMSLPARRLTERMEAALWQPRMWLAALALLWSVWGWRIGWALLIRRAFWW